MTADLNDPNGSAAGLMPTHAMAEALYAGQIALFDYNHLTGSLSLSPYWREYLGTRGPLPTSLDAFQRHVHADDIGHLDSALRSDETLVDNDIFSANIRLHRSNGTALRLRLRGRKHFDGEGDARRAIRTTGSVFELTNEEQALRRSEQRLAAILDNAQDAIISLDVKQRITLFNHGAEAIFGYEAHEILGKPLDILIPERLRSSHKSHIAGFTAGDAAARRMGERGEIFGRRKDGSEFPAEASIMKTTSPDGDFFTTILRDATQRKNDEAALRQQQQLLDTATSHAQVGLAVVSREHRYLYANQTFQRWLHVDGSDIIGCYGPELLGSLYEQAKPYFELALTGKRVTFEMGGPSTNELDKRVYLRTLEPQFDQSGRVGSVIVTVVDITERKRATDELARLNQELEARVADRTRELQEQMSQRALAQEALGRAQRMESIGQLSGGIAHDFNNLLAVISGNLQLMDIELKDERTRGYLSEAEKAVDMGVRLNQRLVTFARRRRFTPVVADLNEIVINLRGLLRHSLGENIALTTRLAPTILPVKIDPGEFENAIINLVVNARDAMPSGGGITIETENIVLSEKLANDGMEPGEYLKLTISDTGAGMPAEVLAHAFEPFFTTKGEGKGTGLGLASVYGFVKQSGGDITIDSQVGRGTVVTIHLPRCHGPASVEATSEANARTLGNGELVLVVEDRPDVRKVAVAQLQSMGYRTLEATDAATALTRLEASGQVDLVFSDIVMPGSMSGFDLARKIRQTRPEQKILLTSGYSEALATKEHTGAQAIPLLEKPYKLAKLSKTVRAILDG